jgi:hypothetical protein
MALDNALTGALLTSSLQECPLSFRLYVKAQREPVTSTRGELRRVIKKVIPQVERIELAAELARGVKVQDGVTEIVYKKPPDLAAIRFLQEYDTGKPAQSLELPDGMDFGFIVIPAQRKPPS